MLLNRSFSLFSPRAISEKQHRGLLIQFILFELFECYKVFQVNWDRVLSPHPSHFPYDWSSTTGHLNKAQEHILLLKEAFSDFPIVVKKFEIEFSKKLESLNEELFLQIMRKIFTALEPLIELCKDNENLIHFMLKNKESIDALMGPGYFQGFLLKIHPCGLEILGEKMCDQYHQRGFFSQIPEFKILLAELHG